MLALIKNNEIIREVTENSRMDYEGISVSPAQNGWIYQDLKLVTIKPAPGLPNGHVLVSQEAKMVNNKPVYVLESRPKTTDEINSELYQAKVNAKEEVKEIISFARSMFITIIPGQEMIYLAKEDEAQRFIADPDPDLINYPLMATEIGITADTPEDLAALWLYMGTQWRTIAAQLEGLRLGTNAKIDAASNVTQVQNRLNELRAAIDDLPSE